MPQGITSDTADYLFAGSNDLSDKWLLSKQNNQVSFSVSDFEGIHGDGLVVNYKLPPGGWVNMDIDLPDYSDHHPFVFHIYNTSDTGSIELKFTDADGSVSGIRVPCNEFNDGWRHVVVYPENTQYWWGGDNVAGQPVRFSIAFASTILTTHTVYLDETGIGKPGLWTSFPSTLDPNRDLPGIGFLQRRHFEMTPEDPLVLDYLKHLQDLSSSAGRLLPDYAGGTVAQTFNNSLAALAFITKNEKERAERILDFYQLATDSNNTDIKKQNFFYNHQARGFYQNTGIESLSDPGASDRWIGDMAWIFFACKHYEETYASDRYEYIMKLIRDLFISYFFDAGIGGFIQSGWRKGDEKLHETSGHHEGNIDCYAVLKLYGDHTIAQDLKIWLDNELDGKSSLPLDLYTWRCLAFGSLDESYRRMPDIAEQDFRYRKIIHVNGTDVMGFFSEADIYTDNFWNDGTGHASCSYQAYGDMQRGYFYANQMDALIIRQIFGNDTTHGIPYTLNNEGYPWVDTSMASLSSSAWYILAKNGVNPFLSHGFSGLEPISRDLPDNLNIYPNPVAYSTNICFRISKKDHVTIEVIPASGTGGMIVSYPLAVAGSYCIRWPEDFSNHLYHPGVYLVRLTIGNETVVKKMVVGTQ